ncbi:hypothetical protein BD413DRAFT_273975 [Trametes elegans]|nr:hypothetical protein BD413DRAFT_273975 [Trametes elegans]
MYFLSKPWERAGVTAAAPTTAPSPALATAPVVSKSVAATPISSPSAPHHVPTRPAAFSTATSSNLPATSTALGGSYWFLNPHLRPTITMAPRTRPTQHEQHARWHGIWHARALRALPPREPAAHAHARVHDRDNINSPALDRPESLRNSLALRGCSRSRSWSPISPSSPWSPSSTRPASSATRSAAYSASSALLAGCATSSPAVAPVWV